MWTNFVICNLCNPDDERRRPLRPSFPRLRQVRRRPHFGIQAEPLPLLRPLAPQPARLQLGRHPDEAEGDRGGYDINLATGKHKANHQDEQKI